MDNFKLWYLRKQNASRASGVPPLTFEANGNPIGDWSITDMAGGVGDRTVNLYNWAATNTENGYVSRKALGRDGSETSVSAMEISEYIPITPLANYYYAYNATKTQKISYCACFYDSMYNVIVGYTFNEIKEMDNILTAPENAAYIRLSINTSRKTGFWLNSDPNWHSYEPYGYKIPILIENVTSNLVGEEWGQDYDERASGATIGDVYGRECLIFSLNMHTSKDLFGVDWKESTGYTISFEGFLNKWESQPATQVITIYYTDNSTQEISAIDIGKFEHYTIYTDPEKTIRYIGTGDSSEDGTLFSIELESLVVLEGTVEPSYKPQKKQRATTLYLDNPLGAGETITGAQTSVAIPTVSGTNVLTVGTAVQPTRVSIRAEPDMPAPLSRYLYSKFINNND